MEEGRCPRQETVGPLLTSEWTGLGIVATSDGANIPRRRARAFHVLWHGDGNVEVLGLGRRDAVGAGDVVGDSQILADETRVARLVDIAHIRPGTVGVDLVEGDDDVVSGTDLRHGALGQSDLGVLGDVDVAGQLGAAAFVDDVGLDLGVADDGCVQLARADGGAVARDRVADLEPDGTWGPGDALRPEDHAMAVDEGCEDRRQGEIRTRQRGVHGGNGEERVCAQHVLLNGTKGGEAQPGGEMKQRISTRRERERSD